MSVSKACLFEARSSLQSTALMVSHHDHFTRRGSDCLNNDCFRTNHLSSGLRQPACRHAVYATVSEADKDNRAGEGGMRSSEPGELISPAGPPAGV